jgi:hypothetical protein
MELGDGIGIVTRLGAGGPGSLGSMSGRDKCYFALESIETVSETHSDSQPMSTGSTSRVVKAAGASSWLLTNTEVTNDMELYRHSTIILHAVNS